MPPELEPDLTSDINAGELDGSQVQTPPDSVPAQGTDAVRANEQPREPSSLREQLSAAFKDEGGKPTDQQGAQPRGPDGKFANKEQQQQPAQPGTEAAQQPLTALEPPQYMQGAEAEQFRALPVEMQHFVARNMAFAEDAAARLAGYGEVERVIAPRRQAWAMNGVSEGQAINQLFAISDFASTAPVDFIRWFAGTQQIDLLALAEGGDEQY
jgi:hypothetical protein